MKRSLEEYLSRESLERGMGGVMQDVSMKYMSNIHMDMSRGFMSVRNRNGFTDRCVPMDYHQYIEQYDRNDMGEQYAQTMEDDHIISMKRRRERKNSDSRLGSGMKREDVERQMRENEIQEMREDEHRVREEMDRLTMDKQEERDWNRGGMVENGAQGNETSSRVQTHNNVNQNNGEKVTGGDLGMIELEDKSLEPLEIEYLERMTEDAELDITASKAAVMKKYTNILINNIMKDRLALYNRTLSENVILKRAYKIQSEVLTAVKQTNLTLNQNVNVLTDRIRVVTHDNQLLNQFVRSIHMENESTSRNFSSHYNDRNDDIEGF